MSTDHQALHIHKRYKGKITTALRDVPTADTLKLYYTPGVGAVSQHIAEHPATLRDYTWTNNLVAVISDGSSVLGLGNIGPRGAMPVMEGKAMLFKHFANIDSIPIVLDVHSTDEIVATIKAIAPSFGGINLEDIAAPQCFEIEERLKNDLNIPVMHDDQHGTAIVALAGLMNACKVTGRQLKDCKIVLMGAGAAGVAIARLLHLYAKPRLIAVDTKGVIHAGRSNLNTEKQLLASISAKTTGVTLQDALTGADIVIGISRGRLSPSDIALMAPNPIVFALANPNPEILPADAIAAGAAVVATGRSDFPNQVNNALAFPGIFRGALDHQVTKITDDHKIAAAKAIAGLVDSPTPTHIMPSVFDERLVPTVSKTIA